MILWRKIALKCKKCKIWRRVHKLLYLVPQFDGKFEEFFQKNCDSKISILVSHCDQFTWTKELVKRSICFSTKICTENRCYLAGAQHIKWWKNKRLRFTVPLAKELISRIFLPWSRFVVLFHIHSVKISYIFGKNFVKETNLLKKLLKR